MIRSMRTILSTAANTTGAAYSVRNSEKATVEIDVTGTITVAIQFSLDGTNWIPFDVGGVTSYTADSALNLDLHGVMWVRAVTTGVSGGSAVVRMGY
jgi:hypothetical protein